MNQQPEKKQSYDFSGTEMMNIDMPKIVIIDDDPQILNLLQFALKNENYNIIPCSTGTEGMSAIFRHRPSLIICDWMMVGLDGLDVCKQVKSDERLRLSYFILLTAWGTVDERVQALDSGVDDFIQKPPNIKELQARVRAGIRIHTLSRQLQLRQAEMDFDLLQAKEYIQSLLPPTMNEKRANGFECQIQWRFIPSAQLGGDIFNYRWIDDNHLAIYLLDVAGHGVGAALLSVSILNVLRSGNLSANMYDPADVLYLLNLSFPMKKQNDLFFTMWYGVFQVSTRTMRYSCAGHPPAVCFYSDSTEPLTLKTKGIPIGMVIDAEYSVGEVVFDSPVVMTLFSDGIYESIPETTGNGSLQTWIELLKKQPNLKHPISMESNLDYIMNVAYTHNGSEKFDDDVSLIQLSLNF